MDWFDSWALTLAVFIPLVGTAVVLAIPRANEQLLKLAALVTTAATLLVGLGILRLVQSGRVQQYALMLFAAVGLLGLALIFFN